MDSSPRLYEIVMARLREKRIPQRTVAEGSGVPFSTVCKIAQGIIKAPSVHHIQALHDYFSKIGPGEAPSIQRKEAA